MTKLSGLISNDEYKEIGAGFKWALSDAEVDISEHSDESVGLFMYFYMAGFVVAHGRIKESGND